MSACSFIDDCLHKFSMNRADLAKTAFLGFLKFEMVTLPYFSRLTSYLVGSGFRLTLMKLSLGCFFLIEYLELLAYLLIVS